MNIVVVGAGGFLGRAILSTLEGKHSLRAFDFADRAWNVWDRIDGPFSAAFSVMLGYN